MAKDIKPAVKSNKKLFASRAFNIIDTVAYVFIVYVWVSVSITEPLINSQGFHGIIAVLLLMLCSLLLLGLLKFKVSILYRIALLIIFAIVFFVFMGFILSYGFQNARISP